MTIEEKFKENKKKEDTYSYKGLMNSDNFWKRAWGVWLHLMAINSIVILSYIIIIAIIFILIK